MFVGDRDNGPVIIVVLPPSNSQLDVICGAEQVYSLHHHQKQPSTSQHRPSDRAVLSLAQQCIQSVL